MNDDRCTLLGCRNPFHDHTPETNAMPALAGMVDPEDPAFEQITRVLIDMRMAGVHLAPATVTAAVKLGKLYHSAKTLPPRAPAPADLLRRHVVYYMRFGDLIKIGTTNDLRRRTLNLKPDTVLAAEPGSYELELQRHRQFARHRAQVGVGRELFFPAPELREHIRQVQDEYGHYSEVADR
jgi:hypothetical protein